jgi:hypothetical protein
VYSRVIKLVFVLSVTTRLTGCATQDAAAPSINSEEMRVLTSDYYWHRGTPLPRYTSEQLDALVRASADPTLDGAYAEQQASRVAVALALVGDARFSEVLARQPPNVKRAVAHEIRYMWMKHGLQYPKTEVLLRPYT